MMTPYTGPLAPLKLFSLSGDSENQVYEPSSAMLTWAKAQVAPSGFPAVDSVISSYTWREDSYAQFGGRSGGGIAQQILNTIVAKYVPGMAQYQRPITAQRLENIGMPLSSFRFPWDTNKAHTMELDPTMVGWNLANAKWYFEDPGAGTLSPLMMVGIVASFIIGGLAFYQATGIGVAGGAQVSTSSLLDVASGSWFSTAGAPTTNVVSGAASLQSVTELPQGQTNMDMSGFKSDPFGPEPGGIGDLGSGTYNIDSIPGVDIGESPLGASSPLDSFDWNYWTDSGMTPYNPGASQAGGSSSLNDIFGQFTSAIKNVAGAVGSVVGATNQIKAGIKQTTANNKAQPNASTMRASLASANLPLLFLGGVILWKVMK